MGTITRSWGSHLHTRLSSLQIVGWDSLGLTWYLAHAPTLVGYIQVRWLLGTIGFPIMLPIEFSINILAPVKSLSGPYDPVLIGVLAAFSLKKSEFGYQVLCKFWLTQENTILRLLDLQTKKELKFTFHTHFKFWISSSVQTCETSLHWLTQR